MTDDMVEESFAGVMAQVFLDDGMAAKDFILERKKMQGTTLHVRNAPTPACTASLAIAQEVVDVASEDSGGWEAGEADPDSAFLTEDGEIQARIHQLILVYKHFKANGSAFT